MFSIAFIGLGRAAHAHLDALCHESLQSSVRVVAGVDPSLVARRAFAERCPKAELQESVRDLSSPPSDLVVVCTWPNLHLASVKASLEWGVRSVLCEKPLAASVSDAAEIVASAAAVKASLAVSHQRRCASRYMAAEEMIRRGVLGRIRLIRIECRGDVLTDGVHAIDLALFLAGARDVVSVRAHVDRNRWPTIASTDFGYERWNLDRTRYGHAVEAGAIVLLELPNDVMVRIETGCFSRDVYQAVDVIGSDGTMHIAGDDQEGPPLQISGARPAIHIPKNYFRETDPDGRVGQFTRLLDRWAAGEDRHLTTGLEGYRNTSIALHALAVASAAPAPVEWGVPARAITTPHGNDPV